MGQFHHHPDGLVYVRGDDGHAYCDTAANFAQDLDEPSLLPAGIVERLYDNSKPGRRHHLFDAAYNQVPGGEWPFHLGERAIRVLDLLLQRQAERNAATSAASKPVPVDALPPHNPSQFPVFKP